MHGLLSRAALSVESLAAGLDRHSGVQPGSAGHVAGLLTRLGDAAAGDLLHLRRINPGPLDQSGLRPAEDFRWVQARERTPPLAYGRPDRLDNHRSGHISS